MNKRDFGYILKRVTRKMLFKVFGFLLLCVFVGCCVLNSVNVKAFSPLVSIDRTVNLIEGESVRLLHQEQKLLEKNEVAKINMQNVGVAFNSNTKLEYVFEIQSKTDNNCVLSFKLINDKIENILIEYQIEDNVQRFENVSIDLLKGESVSIVFLISIENPSLDACLNGNIEINISY